MRIKRELGFKELWRTSDAFSDWVKVEYTDRRGVIPRDIVWLKRKEARKDERPPFRFPDPIWLLDDSVITEDDVIRDAGPMVMPNPGTPSPKGGKAHRPGAGIL